MTCKECRNCNMFDFDGLCEVYICIKPCQKEIDWSREVSPEMFACDDFEEKPWWEKPKCSDCKHYKKIKDEHRFHWKFVCGRNEEFDVHWCTKPCDFLRGRSSDQQRD